MEDLIILNPMMDDFKHKRRNTDIVSRKTAQQILNYVLLYYVSPRIENTFNNNDDNNIHRNKAKQTTH